MAGDFGHFEYPSRCDGLQEIQPDRSGIRSANGKTFLYLSRSTGRVGNASQ